MKVYSVRKVSRERVTVRLLLSRRKTQPAGLPSLSHNQMFSTTTKNKFSKGKSRSGIFQNSPISTGWCRPRPRRGTSHGSKSGHEIKGKRTNFVPHSLFGDTFWSTRTILMVLGSLERGWSCAHSKKNKYNSFTKIFLKFDEKIGFFRSIFFATQLLRILFFDLLNRFGQNFVQNYVELNGGGYSVEIRAI